MTALSVETIEHLDFDHSVPCDGIYQREDCSETAVFRWEAKCCGWLELLCRKHSAEQTLWMTIYLRRSGVDCDSCGNEFSRGLLLSDVVSITTIK